MPFEARGPVFMPHCVFLEAA